MSPRTKIENGHTVYDGQYLREQEDDGRRDSRYAKYECDTVRPKDGDEPP